MSTDKLQIDRELIEFLRDNTVECLKTHLNALGETTKKNKWIADSYRSYIARCNEILKAKGD